ncbi:MAG: 2-dehydropantoate 2-reductase [Kiritimatiellia bacterium]|jgi:2-dehydropantoate 2-reductase|nr:2-dehydropantoate 2-reductase [Kiritimatiellia bacterium]MDP6849012.1 2-dehydropantoate 2-reductase [Kiritimatiellia bacterium]
MSSDSIGQKTDVVVVGPGAIGCLFASMLGRGENSITILDRCPERAAYIERNGVTLEWGNETHLVPVSVLFHPHADTPQADVILVCVKSYDTEEAAKSILPFIGPHTLIASLQNGIGNIERITGVTGHDRTAAVLTSIGATLLGDGHVRYAGSGPTIITGGSCCKLPGECLAEVIQRSGISAGWHDNPKAAIWSKAVVNAAINPITAVSNVPNGEVVSRPELRDLMASAAQEAQAVAEANGIALLYDDAAEEAACVCRNTHTNISSMLQDIRSRRRTEIDAITGEILMAARSAGIPVPVNESLFEQVKALEGREDHSPTSNVQRPTSNV